MPTLQVEDDDEVILVEFAPAPGVRSVSLTPKDIAEKSREAIDDALKTMRKMAKKTVKAIREIPVTERPNSIAVSFGLKLSAEGGAVVAKAGVEAAINVTMTWQRTIVTATANPKRKTK
jgi:hypothetical protein